MRRNVSASDWDNVGVVDQKDDSVRPLRRLLQSFNIQSFQLLKHFIGRVDERNITVCLFLLAQAGELVSIRTRTPHPTEIHTMRPSLQRWLVMRPCYTTI